MSSGTVNQFGAFDMEATRVGEDSSIQRMIRLVQSADAGKAKIVGIADRWATWIVVIALTAAALTWLVTGQIIRAVTILVVFCPCALVLATPTAIMAAIGNATKHGFLVREGDALERLAGVKRIAFDKTGTLTYGTPQVVAVESFCRRLSEEELYRLAACGGAALRAPSGQGGRPLLSRAEAGAADRPRRPAAVPDASRAAACRPLAEGAFGAGGQSGAAGRERRIIPPQALGAGRAACCGEGCTVIYIAVDGALCRASSPCPIPLRPRAPPR